MKAPLRILIAFGTRPEALKCFPVVQHAKADSRTEPIVCATAQHRLLLDQVLELTGMRPDVDLDIMSAEQSLAQVTVRVLERMDSVLAAKRPDFVLVQGDTTTAMAAALSAFYRRIPVGHIEAGLRSFDLQAPWPEELNRRVIGEIATLHFAPTIRAKENLLAERKHGSGIFVTGNTGIDTLLHFRGLLAGNSVLTAGLRSKFSIDERRKLVLVTGHRRENFDGGVERICIALERLAVRDDVQIIYPVHPNPNVRGPVYQRLSGVRNVQLIEPQDYLSFVYLLDRCHVALTDSGGVQEEAPSLGKPVLVMRDNTERPEGVEAGTAIVVGTDTGTIYREVTRLLDDPNQYAAMSARHNPYGDGHAAERIVEALVQHA